MSFINQQVLSAGKVTVGGGGSSAPALPSLTSSGQTLIFRMYADAPTGHLYQDDALTSQAAVGNTVLGIKDLSSAGNHFNDTAGGFGSVYTANAVNSKRALAFVDTATMLENTTAGQVDVVRTATDVTLLCVFRIGGIGPNPHLIKMGRKASGGAEDSFILRIGGGGGYFVGGRWGADSGSSFPLVTYSTTLNASWADLSNKTFKVVLRAKTGLGNVQKLNVAATDGTIIAAANTGYTNLSGDVDGSSSTWDFAALGGYYFTNSRNPTTNGYLCEAALWTGTSPMNDADAASILSYAAGTAGF